MEKIPLSSEESQENDFSVLMTKYRRAQDPLAQNQLRSALEQAATTLPDLKHLERTFEDGPVKTRITNRIKDLESQNEAA